MMSLTCYWERRLTLVTLAFMASSLILLIVEADDRVPIPIASYRCPFVITLHWNYHLICLENVTGSFSNSSTSKSLTLELNKPTLIHS